MLNLPNMLTLARFIMIPMFVYAYFYVDLLSALIIYLLANFTDWLDGYIARKYNQITDFGKLMDPLADKLLLIAVLACLLNRGLVPWWVLAIVALKELLMVVASAFLLGKRNVVVMANMFGKLATLMFFITVVLFLTGGYYAWVLDIAQVLLKLSLAVSVLAMFIYARAFLIKNLKKTTE